MNTMMDAMTVACDVLGSEPNQSVIEGDKMIGQIMHTFLRHAHLPRRETALTALRPA